jgi:hypothetical protein
MISRLNVFMPLARKCIIALHQRSRPAPSQFRRIKESVSIFGVGAINGAITQIRNVDVRRSAYRAFAADTHKTKLWQVDIS